jgi:putative PIN family toxin of toxin-antitoxin system
VKVVLDTNVLVAAFATRGLCEAVFEACLASHEIILSEHILGELHRHLRGKFKMPPRQVDATLAFLREHATVVRPAKVPASACRDRADLAVLGTALAAEADCLVTGDHDLLTLKRFQGIPLLSPRAFHDRLR